MSPEQTVVTLRQLVAAYPRELTDDIIELWSAVFASADDAAMQAAVAEWITTADRFPAPAQIKQIMRDHLRRREMEAPRELESTPTVSAAEGRRIAYDAYRRQVERDGGVPKSFEHFTARLPGGKADR